MNNEQFRNLLAELGAPSEMIEWLGSRDLAAFWNECRRADWMLWLAGRMADIRGWPKRKHFFKATESCMLYMGGHLPAYDAWPIDFPPDKKLAVENALHTAREEYGRTSSPDTLTAAHAASTFALKAAEVISIVKAEAGHGDQVKAGELHRMADLVRSKLRVSVGGLALTEPSTGLNLGTIVFGACSVLTLVVTIAHRVPPIGLMETAFWAGLAWWWQRRNPTSRLAIALVMALAVTIAAGEGYIVGSKLARRFVPYAQNVRYALDTKTGQRCLTLPEPKLELEPLPGQKSPFSFLEPAGPPLCKDLK